MRTNGVCACGSTISIKGKSDKLTAVIENINEEFEHNLRHYINGPARKAISCQLKGKSALAVRTEIVNDLIRNSNSIVEKKFLPILPTLDTLRKMKSTGNARSDDTIDSLRNLAQNDENGIISVGAYPFYLFYRTPLQYEWFLVESKKDVFR